MENGATQIQNYLENGGRHFSRTTFKMSCHSKLRIVNANGIIYTAVAYATINIFLNHTENLITENCP
jgi:hypothetical protein